MTHYPKIDTCFLRDDRGKILFGHWTKREFEYLKDTKWNWYEKIDGTNIRIIYDGEKVLVRGKTDNAQIHTILLEGIQNDFPVELMKSVFDGPVCLYGEGYGTNINDKGKYYGVDSNFILFDCKIGDFWLRQSSLEDISEELHVSLPRLISKGTLLEAIDWVRNIKNDKDHYLEGLILRPEVDLFDRKGERIITKIKRKDFPQ